MIYTEAPHSVGVWSLKNDNCACLRVAQAHESVQAGHMPMRVGIHIIPTVEILCIPINIKVSRLKLKNIQIPS